MRTMRKRGELVIFILRCSTDTSSTLVNVDMAPVNLLMNVVMYRQNELTPAKHTDKFIDE